MDQARYLQVLLAILLAILLYAIQGKVLEGEASWIGWVIAPFWVFGVFAFFVWVPRLLLHKEIARRDVVPGAVFTLLGLVGCGSSPITSSSTGSSGTGSTTAGSGS